jgi:alcohol dehydrogenase class IV
MKELRFHGRSIIIGRGSVSAVKDLGVKRVFLVTGGKSMFENGSIAKIEALLKEQGAAVLVQSGIPANPPVLVIEQGIERMKAFSPDAVIGIGGGSAMDAAKMMALFYEHPELDIETAIKTGLPAKRTATRLVCIPGTSGTASEVTPFAVVTFPAENIKIGGKSPALVPDLAILDPEITLSMPSHVAAETGIDALTHAIECFTNPAVDDFTGCLAAGAVENLFAHLSASVNQGDIDSREKVHYAQCMAGCAFGNTGTGMDHGIAHAFGGRFNLGHGLLNAVGLPYVIRFNSRDAWARNRYEYLARRLGVSDLATAVLALNQSVGIPPSLGAIGVPADTFPTELDALVENSLKGGTRVNPVPISTEEMRLLLTDMFNGTLPE